MTQTLTRTKAKVLLVDDRPENLLALEAILESLDLDLVRAYSGEEALRRVLHQDFALILIDVQMPGMNGFEAASLIKERERSRHIPVIFLTALSKEDRFVFQGYEVGAVDYLLKPLDPDVLRSKVAVFVDLHAKSEQLARQAELLRASDERERRRAEELEARNRGLDAFVALTEAVGSHDDPETVASVALGVLVQYLGDSFAAYYTLEPGPDGPVWRPRLEAGRVLAGLPELAVAGLGAEGPGEPSFFSLEPLGGPVALALLPVVAGERRDWALGCGVYGRSGWDERDRAVASSVARGLGLALERAWLVAETERARLEAEGLAAEREHLIGRLASQNAELEARNAEQETFIYTVSHDLRAPLLSIQGMGELLEEAVERGEIEDARFLLSRVTRNVEKMGQLLNDLLRLSRVGRAVEDAEALELGETVASALAELEPRLKERGVSLELPAAWPRVQYPPSEAYQVTANLLGNAAKFAGRPGEAARVAVRWWAENGQAVLEVADNGPGVPEEYREKVFGLFQRLDVQSAEGTGVGLAIVRRIAERHGGRVWVGESDLGGASFTVTFPLVGPA